MATADTKDRILAAAEALFARQGFAATSLRNVIADAGVNLASVHYHFGSKEELVRAVFGWRFDPINKERQQLLSALEAEGPPSSVERILSCLLLPVLRAAREQPEGWSMVGALVGRVHTEPDIAIRAIFYDQFEEVGDQFLHALGRALPRIPGEELFYRFHFSIAAMAASLVNPEEIRFLSKGRIDPTSDPERFLKRWTQFAAAGLRAQPTPQETATTNAGAATAGARGARKIKTAVAGKAPRAKGRTQAATGQAGSKPAKPKSSLRGKERP